MNKIKQLNTRQFSTEVTTMLWSPKMDLLAISNVKGEVSLYRLTFIKVWLLSPQEESDTTVQLAWRPDGKLLAIGQENGTVLIYIFGMFYCDTITVGNGPILHITGGSNEPIWITSKDDNCIKITRISCPLLEKNKALLEIAQIQANIECLKSHLSRTITATSETWEKMFFELNKKLSKYAEINPPGNMSVDFLNLLMIGIPTVRLERFLLEDLTEKGFKEILRNFDTCLVEIMNLVSENLIKVGDVLVYQLSELRGMVRAGVTHEAELGLRNETLVTNAINESATFLAKLAEFKQVVIQSVDCYKPFFQWLYVTIMQLNDTPVMASKLNEVSQEELIIIAEFLSNLDKTVPKANGKIINVAKVDQYLQYKNLHTPMTSKGSEWTTMLKKNDCLRNYAHIVKHNVNLSLVQCYTNVVAAIENIFNKAYEGLIDHFVMTSTSLSSLAPFISSQIITISGNFLLAMSDIESSNILKFYNIKYSSTEPVSFTSKMTTVDINQENYSNKNSDNVIMDLQFYSQCYLSLFILNKLINASYLLQVPLHDISTFENHDDETIPLVKLMDFLQWPKPFQGISMRWLAVSGPRKVAALLSKNKKRIRLLETEDEFADEEDNDEDEENSNEDKEEDDKNEEDKKDNEEDMDLE
ncbi:anaphase-promoting complex subunit 4-like isoform X2 [Linepithema humile]|uniref:anaphase-promoting complex subunit 4-like isoform X2 n=1 Tax=Linepithema humile TaxID=83485 RepID=UPI00062305EA|nr:PREDICTED: uncharacterized protein LOC105674578 isoform X2 [Linepithema humile]